MEKNILIVDDDEDIVRMVARKILCDAQGKYYPLIAKDGLEALDMLTTHRISLVILDLNMPNLDGAGVCREMSRDGQIRLIPVIISSGYLNAETFNNLYAMGVRHFLDKPYSMNVLFDLIDQMLNREQRNGNTLD